MGRVFAAVMAVAFLGSFAVILAAPVPPNPTSGTMNLWEAYSRGNVAITQVDVTYTVGGQTFTNTLGYEVRNTATVDVRVDEFAMLLSPNPRESSFGVTTQDGVLTRTTVPAGGTVTYGYGDFVAQAILPAPAWWCTEQFQYVQPDVGIVLGGEIVPFAMESMVQSMETGPDGTQNQIWGHLWTDPSLVVGKTVGGSFWREIPESAGQVLSVTLRATNLAIKDTTDGIADPDAPDARVWDVIPTGYVLDAASITPSGSTTTVLPDGSTRISWSVNLPAADITGMGAGFVPTPYPSQAFSYRATTPHIPPGRVLLPRAFVSVGPDFAPEAHSAQPILDVLAVPMPPVVTAGGPYVGVEGDTLTFTAAATDPNGDPIQYRWDFGADGTWDTDWSPSPSTSAPFGDDFLGTVRVQASDPGGLTSTADASVVVRDLDPTIDDLRVTAAGDLTLRVAGEKWHDVELRVVQGTSSWGVSVVRMPGSPDDQAATLEDVELDITEDTSITVYYTPDDDPVNGQPNGANPVWVIFTSGGSEVRLHHTFNVEHPDTYVWTLDDIVPALIGSAVRLAVTASDVGSDDLAFSVDWGDGTSASATVYNDGVGPDPYPSPEVNPITATQTFATAYGAAGTYTITVTVTDDDGASATRTIVLALG